jgi:hypothetical protein
MPTFANTQLGLPLGDAFIVQSIGLGAADRRAHAGRRKRSRTEGSPLCVHGSACGLGLHRWPQRADGINRMRALAQQLVRLQPDIILPNGTAATAALQRETRTIPIIFANVGEPVASGLVLRLDRGDKAEAAETAGGA